MSMTATTTMTIMTTITDRVALLHGVRGEREDITTIPVSPAARPAAATRNKCHRG